MNPLLKKITATYKIWRLKNKAISNIKKVADNHKGEPIAEELERIMKILNTL